MSPYLGGIPDGVMPSALTNAVRTVAWKSPAERGARDYEAVSEAVRISVPRERQGRYLLALSCWVRNCPLQFAMNDGGWGPDFALIAAVLPADAPEGATRAIGGYIEARCTLESNLDATFTAIGRAEVL